ncbi:epoxide hydrolase A [Iodidimonas muriae]|uniref:Epoxide hydrolase A n=1 Tax=Iodidimonas muriae TaxID=261467 RepID=A0ABQ2LD08_9PROT|nr:alpha/beta hydrolase [Iodidimonas muriae]GER08092.1 epoxide hydrolase A [Kordiimonadales bacterium JCM 17843]GGO08879.1 epoxide hydrolase A [Iodidimonas muriae]
MFAFPVPEMVETNGIRLAVHRAGPSPDRAKAVVLLLHGFPDLAFTWRHQVPVLAGAGYCVLAPDLRGFGRSDKPQDRSAYGMEILARDVTGLLDHYQVHRAFVIGHDWGALINWSLPFYCPDRLHGIANLNIPFLPRGSIAPIALFKAAFGKQMYIVRFQEEGPCEAIFEQDMARTMAFFFRKPKIHDGAGGGGGAFSVPDLDLVSWLQGPCDKWPGDDFLPERELAVYVEAFREGGMTAPLHYYRNMDANWRDMERFQPAGKALLVDSPALMITADKDGVCPPHLADGKDAFFTDYRRVDIKDCGHWTQQEKPDEVNAILLEWLGQSLPKIKK